MKKTYLLIAGIVVAAVGLALWWQLPSRQSDIATFAECVAAGYPVTESFPRVCRTPEGKKFVEPKVTKNTNTTVTPKTNSATNTTTNSMTATRGESRFGVHTGSLRFEAAQPFVAELGSQIWVRDGAGLYRDEYGWGKKGYNNPPSRRPLPDVEPTRFFGAQTSRYDDVEPDRAIPAYPFGHEQNYTDYLDYLLDKYAGILTYWEIENEVDGQIFWAGTAQDYADLVELASGVIKPRCPTCRVGVSFSGPTIAKNQEYFSALKTVCSSFDFFDIHSVLGILMQPGDLDRWKQTCPGKEFISTESGISDAPSGKQQAAPDQAGSSQDAQARDLAKYNTLMFAAGYSKIFWYLIDTDYNTIDIFLHNALLDEDGTKKPSFTAYKTMIEKTDSFTSLAKLGDGQYKYTFADKDPVYVLWCDSGSCRMPSEISGQVTVTDYLGTERTQNASDITLSSNPVFVTQ